jgi:catechol 2,3-dioxygenase-like lactoylglutathione lyase family enzyme
MSIPITSLPIRPDADATVRHIHHVGHVVRDIGTAISLYRRMGFVVPPPSFPALPLRPGEPAQAFGAGNTDVSFSRGFVELVTVVDDDHTTSDVLADATLVPLQAPAETLDQLRESIAQTAARISTALARFEGLHILVFGTTDVEATVARLEAEGVPTVPSSECSDREKAARGMSRLAMWRSTATLAVRRKAGWRLLMTGPRISPL